MKANKILPELWTVTAEQLWVGRVFAFSKQTCDADTLRQ